MTIQRWTLLFVMLCWSSLAAADRRPNIIFFLADDQRNDSLGCAGHPIIKTPEIDKLATNGVLFQNSFVTTSICWVSRAATLTGRTVRAHGQDGRIETVKPAAAAEMYPVVLRKAGYRTAHFGKWHARMPKGFNKAQEFDAFKIINRHPFFHKQKDGTFRHETQLIGDEALKFIDGQPADKPFMMQLWFNAAHAEDADKKPGSGHFPWPKSIPDSMYEDQEIPAPRLNDPKIYESQPDFLKRSINRERFFWRWDTKAKYETNMRAYFRMISGIDHVVGRVRSKLAEKGLDRNTVIVYSADNGYYMGDRGFAGKWTHYEQSLRVPMIIYDPRIPAAGRGIKLDSMVLNVDLSATFLDLAGLKPPASYQGRSLWPFVRNAPPSDWRQEYFVEHVSVPPLLVWEGVRAQRYVYARYLDVIPVFEFLHDLKTDPDQLRNLASDPKSKEVLAMMRKRCDEHVAKNGGPLPPLNERYGRKINAPEHLRSSGPIKKTPTVKK